MRATSKVVLFGKLTHAKVAYQWPVAVFANDKDARSYVTYLNLAYRAGDDKAITALNPKHPVNDDGRIPGHPKWSLVTVPYAPLPELDESDNLETDTPPTE